ncbi:ead/Ea22-like family protein [Cronobacter malonaticus]
MTIDTAKLKAAALAATPGEWCPDDHHGVIADAGLNANFYIASCSGPEHRANKRFIAAANPAAVLELIAALESARADCRENAARIAELESQRKLAFSACNRWADKCREAEKRVAELEARTVSVKLPEPATEGGRGYRQKVIWALQGAFFDAGINLETGGEA